MLCFSGWSQIDTTEVSIRTLDKRYYDGELFKITNDSVYLYGKENQILGFLKSNIEYFYNGSSLISEMQNVNEPFYVSTARNNGKGNNYYKNYFLFGNNFSYGLKDNLDFSLGFEFISIISGNGAILPVMQLGLSYGRPISESFSIGLSTKVLFNDDGGTILASIPFTFGGKRSNFTFSPTVGFVTEEDEPLLVILMNWNIVLGRKTRLVTDAMIIKYSQVGTAMIEYTFSSGNSFLGGMIVSNDFIVPNFSFVIPFGKWKIPRKISM